MPQVWVAKKLSHIFELAATNGRFIYDFILDKMKIIPFRFVVVIIILIFITSCKTKRNEDLIIGTWQSTESFDSETGMHTQYKFNRDSVTKVFVLMNGNTTEVRRAAYKIDNTGKYILFEEDGKKKDKAAIMRITKTDLLLSYEGDTSSWIKVKE